MADSGGQAKNEMCREIPTNYSDHFGNAYEIHFDVVSVNRDDLPKEFHLHRVENGMKLCFVDSSEAVPPGNHTYELTYTVNRELGVFADFDELYWNATGNGWTMPIQSATATVHLFHGIAPVAILLDGYTGQPGSMGNAFQAAADTEGNATFRTTRPLAPSESLTLVVRWPKGFVHSPTEAQKHQYYLDDNQSNLIGLLGLGVILLYYVLVWFIAGRGRARGETLPRSHPPQGFSPAALRYIWRMAFDQKTFVVNLVDLGVKKQLAILQDAAGSFILGRVKTRRRARIDPNDEAPDDVTSDEKLVLKKIFSATDPLPLSPRNHAIVGAAVEALHQRLRAKLEWVYFLSTSRYVVPGLLISIAAVVRAGLTIQGVERRVLLPLAMGMALWSLASLVLGGFAIGTFKNVLVDPHHLPTAKRQAIGIGIVASVLLVGELVGLAVLSWAASPEVAGLLFLLVGINFFFHLRLRTQTLSGHGLMDQIEGLRLFLVDTGDGNSSVTCPPDQFERLLPYALALNVEKVWGEKFAAWLASAPKDENIDYEPSWFSGPNWKANTASMFLTLLGSSFSSAILWASSATGPHKGSTGISGDEKY